MSSLAPPPRVKFLLDENVKNRLLEFLRSGEYDVVIKPKGLSNGKLASFSKSEKRVLVTNDVDFSLYPKNKIFSVVLLRIPQYNPESLTESFSKLLKDKYKSEDFEGFLVELKEGGEFKFSPIKSIYRVGFSS
ncbi:DUF5615 family PIN-like protein [Candidatus Woesearchaeota archaeon]|nr:DUF5615 family PIN-like protein [Candidatus Woesearchaeota archaeon]